MNTRDHVTEALNREVDSGKALLVQGASNGLVARCIADAGVDLIAVYNTGYYRINGWPSILGTLPVGNANDIVMSLASDVLLMARNVPVLAGVYAHDPTRDLRRWLDTIKDTGFSGIINVPTVGRIDGTYRTDLELNGASFSNEVKLMGLAHERDLIATAYVYTAPEAAMMAEAGADLIIAHAGLTAGGDVGASKSMSMEHAIERTRSIVDAVKATGSRAFCLCHGGPIASPEDADRVNRAAGTVGFLGASAVERIPVENALKDATRDFKRIGLPS